MNILNFVVQKLHKYGDHREATNDGAVMDITYQKLTKNLKFNKKIKKGQKKEKHKLDLATDLRELEHIIFLREEYLIIE